MRPSVRITLAGALLFAVVAIAQGADSPALMPLPSHMVMGDGQLTIDSNFSVALKGYTEPRLISAKARFLDLLFRETGIPFQENADRATFVVTTNGASDAVQKLGEDESYHLTITTSGAELRAANPLGILHGLQTFLQLVHVTPQGFAVPAVTIDDSPRFPWRGLMIDAGRHFMPVPVIERNLDGMEAVKLNVFHWHLSEDQGFRAQSTVYPLLTKDGSNGQFYTQQEIRDVIAYARDRGIRVVPEFDVPCHTTSWFVGYPQLASAPGPFQVETRWGVMDPAMDPTRESTYQFLDRFFGEMAALFPDVYFHIGGDECNGKEWDANARIQAFMHTHNLKDNAALQSYFSGRVEKIVAGHHKIMEGWDEVLQPDTPKDVVIQSWRGPEALAVAARQGNRGLLSNGYYIDLNQSAAQHYLADPLGGEGASLTPEERKRVLGGEATMWSEFVTPENVDSRIWPRTAAIAERLWSPQDVRDVDSMYARLAVVSQRLENYGLQHRFSMLLMLQRMSGETDPHALRVLAGVVQPPEGYQREELKNYDTTSPLNRMVDAVPPESNTAREFAGLVKQVVAGNASQQQWHQARTWLELWRDNDAKLQPTLKNSELTAELAPVSSTLAQVATIGLQALDNLEHHRQPGANALQSDLNTLEAAGKPQAVLRDMVVEPVRMLVEASGKSTGQ
ncbi:MAG TPA: family 20 glycosylhydrolase [Terracidiphilus sp.]|nr:family 20 glycosylhydrolase [Terracidiphilus sp.]